MARPTRRCPGEGTRWVRRGRVYLRLIYQSKRAIGCGNTESREYLVMTLGSLYPATTGLWRLLDGVEASKFPIESPSH